MKLTDSKIKGLKPSSKRYIVWDPNGLGVRISTYGKKSFILSYRFNGRPRMMTLGQYPNLGLASARRMAAHAIEKIEKGIDPGAEKLERAAVHRDALTVERLVEEYLEKWSKPRKATWKEDERCLKKDVVPRIGRKKAKEIRRRDIIQILDEIVERDSPAMANRTHNILSKMFSFAVVRDILDASPVTAIPLPGKKGRRERTLSESEIKIFWHGLEKTDMTLANKLALKLLLVTGQRRGELASSRIRDMDLKSRWWTIPGDSTKNGLAHRVWLSDFTVGIINEARDVAGASEYLLPSPRTGTHIDPRAITRALRKAQEDFEKIEKSFTVHDLRRTAASQMTSMGISRLVVQKILNHQEQGVIATYDRYSYDEEKREALNAWGQKLESIVHNSDSPSEEE